MWLCWLTPGIAAGLFFAIYFQWFWKIFSPEPAWYSVVLWVLIGLVLFGCAGFAAVIHAGKSGSDGKIRRVVTRSILFVIGQVFVAPLIGWMLLFLIFRT